MNRARLLLVIPLVAATALVVVAQSPGRPHPAAAPRTRPATRSAPPKRRPGSAPWQRRLTDDQVDQLLGRVKQEQPDMYERLVRLRRENPGAFRRAIAGVDRLVRYMDSLPAELREVVRRQGREKLELVRLVKEYQAESSAKRKAKLEREIGALVARQFDDEQKMREYRLTQLTKQLEELKRQMEQRAANRDRYIEERTQSLLRRPPEHRPWSATPRTRPATRTCRPDDDRP